VKNFTKYFAKRKLILFLIIFSIFTFDSYAKKRDYNEITVTKIAEKPAKDKNASAGYVRERNVISVYDNKFPSNIPVNPKYSPHPSLLEYVFVRSKWADIYSNSEIPEGFAARSDKLRTTDYDPNSDRKEMAARGVTGTYPYMTKLKLLQQFTYKSNLWYKVVDPNGKEGYIVDAFVSKRIFRAQKALDKIHELQRFINTEMDKGRELVRPNTYSPNPSNKNAKTQKDKYGTSWEQNAVAKTSNGETIFIPDSSIMSIISTDGKNAKVKVASIPEELTVSAGLLSRNPKISKNFRKVVAVDIENQNTIMFEKNSSGNWEIVSYVYSKTGIESHLGYETPKGFFIVPVIKFTMGYTDAQGRHEGNARYAMRFSGGGYMHGTPIAFSEEGRREQVMGQRNKLLGLYTGTRKCIRTSEEHARFMFEWMCANPVKNRNEQTPSENIMFIIF